MIKIIIDTIKYLLLGCCKHHYIHTQSGRYNDGEGTLVHFYECKKCGDQIKRHILSDEIANKCWWDYITKKTIKLYIKFITTSDNK